MSSGVNDNHGFSIVEPRGGWSLGDTSVIRFRLPNDAPSAGMILELRVCSLPGEHQMVSVGTSGFDVASYTVEGESAIVLQCPETHTPASQELNSDCRLLAILYFWIRLS